MPTAEDIRTALREVQAVVDLTEATSYKPLRAGLFYVIHETLQTVGDLADQLSRDTATPVAALPPTPLSPPPSPPTSVVPDERSQPATSVSRRTTNYNSFMSEMLHRVHGHSPSLPQKEKFSLAVELWRIHKGAGSLEEILAAASTDLTQRPVAPPAPTTGITMSL